MAVQEPATFINDTSGVVFLYGSDGQYAEVEPGIAYFLTPQGYTASRAENCGTVSLVLHSGRTLHASSARQLADKKQPVIKLSAEDMVPADQFQAALVRHVFDTIEQQGLADFGKRTQNEDLRSLGKALELGKAYGAREKTLRELAQKYIKDAGCSSELEAKLRADKSKLERDLQELQEKFHNVIDQRNAVIEKDRGYGGLFRMQFPDHRGVAKHELVEKVRFDAAQDGYWITWSPSAKAAYSQHGLGAETYVDAGTLMTKPRSMRATSWHHLCSIVGLIEPLARIFYVTEEVGQESAVAKAKPYHPRDQIVIHCQGDYID